jgi:hypothetical protein
VRSRSVRYVRKFRKRVRPSRFHVLQSFTGPGLSPFTSQTTHSTCWTRMRAARLANAARKCDARVRALDQFLVVKQRPGRTSGAGDLSARAHGSCRGLHLAAETLSGWFFADSERDLRWLGSRGCPVRLAPAGQGALEAVTDWVRSRSRDGISRRATSYPKSGSRAHRDSGRVAFFV